MTKPWVQCRHCMRRTALVMVLVMTCFLTSARGYSDVVNVGDVASAGSLEIEATAPPPTTTAPPPPTTTAPPPPTTTAPPPTTTSPPPTTTAPPPTTATPTTTPPPPPPRTTPPPPTTPPPTVPPPPPTTTPAEAGVPPPTTTAPTTRPPTPSTTTNATTVPAATAAKPPSTTPTVTNTGSADGLTGGGRADAAKPSDPSSSGRNTLIIAGVVIATVVLVASLYVFRRHRSKKEDTATELRRQLDQQDLELGQSAYISTRAAATDDIIAVGGAVGGNSGSGNGSRGSRSSVPFQKNQQSPASWSSERTTAVSATDRDSLHGLWKDPELLAARIPYEKLHFGELLNRGGFGEVYVGEYHNRRVAIKQLIPDNSKRMAAIEDFLKEAALLVPLEHERIVAFVGVAWDSPRDLCLVLEFMPNGDLRNLLAEWRQDGAKTGWADIRKVRIALHVAEALTYLHTLSPKIVHRDLKSKNILLDEQWQAKLSDFGISRIASTQNTMTTNVGSSLWIAPEVMMGSDYNEKADIFSFGIVLTELDSLQLPYHNALTPDGRKMPDAAVLHLVTMGKLQAEFTSMSRTDMVLLGRACLAMDPSQRPSAGEIRFRLSQILGTY